MAESKGGPRYLADYGARVLDRGYEIIPIRPGTKRPPGDNWQKIRADKARLKKWIDGGRGHFGVGILTRKTPLVDIDVPDARISAHMVSFVQERFGPAPIRVGLAPKTGLLFRSAQPFAKVQSKIYVDEWADPGEDGKGQWRKVEILGDGQQFVAYAIHPDTGKPYAWDEMIGEPLDTHVRDLPEMTQENARLIVEEFDRIALASGWERDRPDHQGHRQQRHAGNIPPDDGGSDHFHRTRRRWHGHARVECLSTRRATGFRWNSSRVARIPGRTARSGRS